MLVHLVYFDIRISNSTQCRMIVYDLPIPVHLDMYIPVFQYYVYLGGDRFVDLGLGTQRVKCQVHKDFR